MKRHTPRFLVVLVSVCMLFSQIPAAAFAAVTMTDVANQQVQYGIGIGSGQSTIGENGVVDVELCLKGTPYIHAEAPTDVILLIDKSFSMGGKIAGMKEAAKNFVDALDLSVHRIGIVPYDSVTYSEPISDDKAALKAYIDNIPNNSGGTAMDAAINKAVELLAQKRAGAEGAIVLMTDGEANDPDAAMKSAEAAKALDYSFFTVALCNSEDSQANKNLKKMATSEADHYSVFSVSKLNSVYSNIASKIGDVNAKDVVITQIVNGQFDIVPGSTDNNIPLPTVNGNTLIWKMTQLVKGDVTLSYQIKPKAGIPEKIYNHAVGNIFYTDYAGNRVKFDIPMQEITLSYNGPVISAITPDKVDYKGGDEVVITGEYFRPGAIVTVDGKSVGYTYVSDKELKFTMPAHDISKKMMVKVQNPNGKCAYGYIAVTATNAITSIVPNTVQENKKQRVTISGAGFNGNYKTTSVYVGTSKASVVSVSNETIICLMPKLPAGVYDVKVVNSDGTTSTLAGGYTSIGNTVVVDPCTITSITPNTIDENTAQNVKITGTKFNGSYKSVSVKIGTYSANVTSVNDTTIACRVPKLPAGSYDVTVVNEDGTTATLTDGYTVTGKVVPTCTITSITPDTVEEDTAQNVKITGTKFNGSYKSVSVKIGTYSANVTSVNNTTIVCRVPKLPAGSYDVTVINEDGTTATLTDGYTATATVVPTCTITSITPNTVEENTVQNVKITGTKFNGSYKSVSVKIGTYSANVTSVNDTTIACRIPKLPAGSYDVTVVNEDGTTATLAGGYTANAKPAPTVPACTITSITPNTVEEDTAQNVTIKGTKLNGSYKSVSVKIGTYSANVTSVNDTTIVCRVPKLPAGSYDVTVVNEDGTTATLAGGYTVNAKAVPTCQITSLSITTADENTRPNVTLYGSMFNGDYKSCKVYFGATPADVASVSDNQIVCKAPALPVGTYTVKVENADATTATYAGTYEVKAVPVPTCTITSLDKTAIAANVRTNIWLYGTEFNGSYKAVKVYIGSTEASVAEVHPTSVKCRTAKLPAGVYDVTIVNADGTTAILANALTVS